MRIGCRAGVECPYIHDASTTDQKAKRPDQHSAPQPSTDNAQNIDPSLTAEVRNLSIAEQASSHTASQPQRPISKTEQKDPREFQINQLRRRFRPEEKADDKGSTLLFGLAPSDPDFPFELDKLQCVLHVPLSYPGTGRPTLSVTNAEMDPAYRANVARGFDDIVDFTLRTDGQGSLLSWMNSLDKQLERLLTTLERGPKLKFVANLGGAAAKKEQNPPLTASGQGGLSQSVAKRPNYVAPAPAPKAPVATKVHTAAEKSQAEKRRSMETKQLEARLGRLPLFQKRTETSWVVPVQPNKKDRLPISLQTIKTVKLLVPQLYPLELSSIEIQANDSPEARSVEIGFAQWVEKNSQMNLVSQVNYLASNMHNLAKTPLPEVAEHSQHEHIQADVESSLPEPADGTTLEGNGDRPHLHVIPRPPEWSVPDPNSDSDITDESSYDEEYSDEGDGEDESEGGAPVPAAADDTPGRGVALSFPFLELYGIELLELIHLAITIKCERCKQTVDVKNVPQIQDPRASPKVESCRRCANSMSIGGSQISVLSGIIEFQLIFLYRFPETDDAFSCQPSWISRLGRMYHCGPSS